MMTQKVEESFLSVIRTGLEGAGVTVHYYRSREDGATEFELPALVIEARAGQPIAMGQTGNFMGLRHYQVTIKIWVGADVLDYQVAATPEDEVVRIVEAVEAIVEVDDLAAQLTAAVSDYHVYAAMPMDPPEQEPDGRNWAAVAAWDVVATEGDLV